MGRGASRLSDTPAHAPREFITAVCADAGDLPTVVSRHSAQVPPVPGPGMEENLPVRSGSRVHGSPGPGSILIICYKKS